MSGGKIHGCVNQSLSPVLEALVQRKLSAAVSEAHKCRGQVDPSLSPPGPPFAYLSNGHEHTCPAFPHHGVRVPALPAQGRRPRGTQESAYLCLMELPRSLRGICGDQRGTDSVSVRREAGRACYTEGQGLAWAPAKPWKEEEACGPQGGRRPHRSLTQSQAEPWCSLCSPNPHEVPCTGQPESASEEASCAENKMKYHFHVQSA